MNYKFKELSVFDFKKVDIGLQSTKLIKEYSQLKFNGGFVLATIGSHDPEQFRDYLKSLYPSSDECDMNIKTGSEADIKDFIYHLLGNNSLADLDIYLGDGEEFLTIDPPYDSLDEFRKLAFAELTKAQFEKQLHQTVLRASIYDNWKVSEEQTLEMISDFIDHLFPKEGNFRIFSFQQWGNFMIGLFEGFIFLNIDRGQLTFFARDDYD